MSAFKSEEVPVQDDDRIILGESAAEPGQVFLMMRRRNGVAYMTPDEARRIARALNLYASRAEVRARGRL